jgi:hypothetical protein
MKKPAFRRAFSFWLQQSQLTTKQVNDCGFWRLAKHPAALTAVRTWGGGG